MIRDGSKYLTVEQAATYLGISATTLNHYRLVPGVGPDFVRIGKRRLAYRIEDLDKYAVAGLNKPLAKAK